MNIIDGAPFDDPDEVCDFAQLFAYPAFRDIVNFLCGVDASVAVFGFETKIGWL